MSRVRGLVVCVALSAVSFACNRHAAEEDGLETRQAAATVPTGFVETVVGSGLTVATALAMVPDGRVLVAQQNGIVRVIKNDALLATSFIDISVATDGTGEHGMLGIAVDPSFATNQYVYLYYTANPCSGSGCGVAPPSSTKHNRILRVTANGDVANAATITTLVDFDNVPTGSTYHIGGAMHFGPDGKMYVAVGDHQTGHLGQTGPPQQLNSFFGKILRFNSDGTIPTDNPFYTQTTGNYRAIYVMGLRNSFTFNVKPDGKLYISEVGEGTWEEINVSNGGGQNFGWPITEGDFSQTTYPNYTRPVYTYNHSAGCSILGAAFYNPTTAVFPSSYVGKFFFADYCSGKISMLDPATNTATVFASGITNPVTLDVSNSGALYYVSRGGKGQVGAVAKVFKVTYTGANTPQISQQPSSLTVTAGQPASFTIAANNATSYQWQRWNGTAWANISGATATTYTIASTVAGDNGAKFRCNAINANGTTTSSEAVLTVSSNQLPVPTIVEPALLSGTAARIGWEKNQIIGFVGSATDPEDGVLPASAFTWQVDLQHDTHAHPYMPPTSNLKSGTFTALPDDNHTAADMWFRVYLTVTDSGGRQATTYRDIRPSTFLSDMTWTSATNGYGPAEKDLSNGGTGAGDGHSITLDGLVYGKGLGVHAPSDVRYALNGDCKGNFIADVGVDDESLDTSAANVIFQVWLDGVKAFDSGAMTATTLRKPVAVSVAGVNELKLVVDPNGTTNSDHSDWAAARVTGCSSNVLAARKRVAYYPIWNSTADDLVLAYPQNPVDVPWEKISHMNLAYVGINASYNCAFVDQNEAAQPGWQTNAQNLISYRNAHAPGVKVLLSLGGWFMSYRFSQAMNATNRTAFVNSCVSLMSALGADGIDIDWQFPTALGATCPSGLTCSSASDPANFTATMGAFRAATGFAGKLLTASVRGNQAGDGANIPYEYANFFTGTPRRLDWVNVITYDYHSAIGANVNFTAPYDKSTTAMDYVVKGPNGVDDTTDGVGSANKGRVVLGVPYFGHAWYNVATPGTSGVGNSGTAVVAWPLVSKAAYGKAKANFFNRYPAQCLLNTPTTGNTQNRYLYCGGSVGFCQGAIGNGSSALCATNGGTWMTESNVWLSYEDAYVVGNKADWVGAYNWGGMMWWTQGDDTDTDELTATIGAKLAVATQNPVVQSAYGGSNAPIPGRIEAEDYDVVPAGYTGEMESYHDTSAGNTYADPANPQYSDDHFREEDVDVEPNTDEGAAANAYDVASTTAGEWLEYTVNVVSSGPYTMSLRVAAATATESMHVEMDTVTIGSTIAVPNTGGMQIFQTVSQSVNLAAGTHVMRVTFDTGAAAFNWIDFTAAGACVPETDATLCGRLGASCGAFTGTDNCGSTRTVSSCGSCNAPETCGGNGTPNICGCTHETDAAFCARLGDNCGAVSGTDNCGASRAVADCGSCTTPQTCGGGGTANVCGSPPAAPGAPTLTAADAQVSVSWGSVATATSYNVKRSTTTGTEVTVYTTSSTSWVDTGRTNGQIYYYKISALNGGGEGPDSPEASATPTALGPPTGLTPTAGVPVGLSWTAPTGTVTNYEIWRGTTAGGETLLTTVASSPTSYTDATVAINTTYYYKVRAKNGAAVGTYSAEVSAATGATKMVDPTYDLFVRDGTGAANNCNAGNGTNCGQATADSMAVKLGTAGSNRFYYVLIPLSSVPAGTLPATTKLRLYGNCTTNAKTLNVYKITNTSWTETLTYNGANGTSPSMVTEVQATANKLLGVSVSATAGNKDWSGAALTSYIQTQKASNPTGFITLGINYDVANQGDSPCGFNRREAASNKPQLRVE